MLQQTHSPIDNSVYAERELATATQIDGTPVAAPGDGCIVFPNPAALPGNEWFYFARRSERVLRP